MYTNDYASHYFLISISHAFQSNISSKIIFFSALISEALLDFANVTSEIDFLLVCFKNSHVYEIITIMYCGI